MMTPLVLYCVITQVINAITSFSLGFYVLAKNRRPIANRTFAALAISISFWSTAYALWVMSEEMGPALFWNRILMVGCVPIPTFFLHFVVSLLGINAQKRYIIRASYVLTMLTLLSIPTPLLVASVTPKMTFYFWANPGPFFFVYTIHFMFCFFYNHHLMYRELMTATGNRRSQIKYVFLGTLPAFAGGSTNFFLWYNIPVPPIGNVLVSAYVAMVAYAILQHHLMDISVVVRKSFAYSLLVTSLTVGYFVLVYGAERIFQLTIGYSSPWLSLIAFALMAFLFQPLKIWAQRLTDFVFFHAPREEIVKRMERLEEQALQAEKFKAVSTLAAGMAHEIKNPLTALQTFAEFLPERENDPEFRKQLREVLTLETRRIRGIVQDLLEFAKPKPPQLKPLDIEELIRSTVNLLSGDLLKQRIRWDLSCQHNGAALYADPDQLRQVLINLILNAADAMPQGGALTVATRFVNSHLELTVTDTGKGIPADLLPKIFDPFVSTKPDGTGLGLSVVYSIIQTHRGSIRATSHPGRGTTFTVSLPL